MTNASRGSGKYVLVTMTHKLKAPYDEYRVEHRFLFHEARASFKLEAQRHGIRIEKEYEDE